VLYLAAHAGGHGFYRAVLLPGEAGLRLVDSGRRAADAGDDFPLAVDLVVF